MLLLLSGFLASFNVLVPRLLTRRQEKTRLSYPAQRKSSKKLPSFHFNCSKSSFEHRPKIFLPWKGQFSSKHLFFTRFGCENRKGEVRRYANSVLPLTSLSAFQAVDFWLRSDASYKLLPEEVDLLLDFRFPVRWYVGGMKVSCLFTFSFLFFFFWGPNDCPESNKNGLWQPSFNQYVLGYPRASRRSLKSAGFSSK